VALKTERKRELLKEQHKEFYCKDCDKQYKTVQAFEEHCNSYDHHHTVRIREMRRADRQRKMSGMGKKRKKSANRREEALQARIRRAQELAGTSTSSNTGKPASNTATSTTRTVAPSFGIKKKKKRKMVMSFSFNIKKR